MRLTLGLFLVGSAASLAAQVSPTPGHEDRRLQTLVQPIGQRARLTIYPEASLTLIMPQGERIERVFLSDNSAFHVAVTGETDSVSVTPLHPVAVATMSVETDRERHEFNLETGRGLDAAYVVRLVRLAEGPGRTSIQAPRPNFGAMAGRYSLRGDRSLRPEQIADDGSKTYIEWGAEQSLPAVLGIGPTGEEEVVAGYMRRGIFTIDRIYSQLVFRIDRQKTIATREIGKPRNER